VHATLEISRPLLLDPGEVCITGCVEVRMAVWAAKMLGFMQPVRVWLPHPPLKAELLTTKIHRDIIAYGYIVKFEENE